MSLRIISIDFERRAILFDDAKEMVLDKEDARSACVEIQYLANGILIGYMKPEYWQKLANDWKAAVPTKPTPNDAVAFLQTLANKSPLDFKGETGETTGCKYCDGLWSVHDPECPWINARRLCGFEVAEADSGNGFTSKIKIED